MRKYEVELEDGRIVSRQYASQLKLRQENPEKYKELQKAKYQRRKDKINAYQKAWLAKFKEEHGMSYAKWYAENKKK